MSHTKEAPKIIVLIVASYQFSYCTKTIETLLHALQKSQGLHMKC